MPPTIHLVRHAQGIHNVSVDNEHIRDPDLTPLGREQCASLRSTFPHHAQLTGLISSPLRRTIQTCVDSFGQDALYPITLIDVLQEVSDAPCDTGSSAEALGEEFGGKVDAQRVRAAWTDKKSDESPFQPTLDKLISRAREARRTLREVATKEDGHYIATSHGGFLHFLTDDWHGIPSGSATGWKNCEWRSYQFVDPTGKDEAAALVETAESWQRRQGSTIPPSETEMRELRSVAQEELAPLLKFQS